MENNDKTFIRQLKEKIQSGEYHLKEHIDRDKAVNDLEAFLNIDDMSIVKDELIAILNLIGYILELGLNPMEIYNTLIRLQKIVIEEGEDGFWYIPFNEILNTQVIKYLNHNGKVMEMGAINQFLVEGDGTSKDLVILITSVLLDGNKLYYKSEEPIQLIDGGDWIDLRAAEDVTFKAPRLNVHTNEMEFDSGVLKLDFTCRLPKGCEAIVAPRSSTFKKYGITVPNSIGVIDNSYCGDGDQWGFPYLAFRDGQIKKGDRVAQFRILTNQGLKETDFIRTNKLYDKNRGGFGSTGHK